MDHQTALNMQAAEKYSLGELTSPQREDFEEHFFGCPDCAAALQELDTFAANARAVFAEDAAAASAVRRPGTATAFAAPASTGWWRGLPDWFGIRTLIPASAIAAALVLGVVMLRTPDSASAASFAWTMAPDVRDEVPHEVIAPNTVWLTPSIDLLPSVNQPNRWVAYHWQIQNAADSSVVAEGDGQNGAGQLTLKVPASKFDSGKVYRLVVQGDRATSPESASFVIDRKIIE